MTESPDFQTDIPRNYNGRLNSFDYKEFDTVSSVPTNYTVGTFGFGQSTLNYTGTLNKWTNYYDQWQWRYLTVGGGKLNYFKSKSQQHLGCRGSLSLAFASINSNLLDPSRFNVNLPKANANWYFRADSEVEKDKWVAIIKSNVEFSLRMHNHKKAHKQNDIELATNDGMLDMVMDRSMNCDFDGSNNSTASFYEMHSSTASLCPSDSIYGSNLHLNECDKNTTASLKKLRNCICEIHSCETVLVENLKIDEKEQQSNSPNYKTIKFSISNVLKSLSTATDILCTHESTWRQKFNNLNTKLEAQETALKQFKQNNIYTNSPKISQISRLTKSKGHRRTSSLTTNQKYNGDIKSQDSKLRRGSQNIPPKNKPNTTELKLLEEDEFFDAMDELSANFDRIEQNLTFNEKQVQKLIKQDENDHRFSIKLNARIQEHVKSLAPFDGEDWIEFYKDGSMTLYRKDESTPDGRIIDPIRLFHKIENISAFEALIHFWDTKYRNAWNFTLETFRILEVLNTSTVVIYEQHKKVFMTAQREGCYCSNIMKYDFTCDDECYVDTWIVTNFSVDHKDAMIDGNSSRVRVFLDICMMCQTFKKDPNKPLTRSNIFTKVIYISQIDPGGWVPAAALRSVYKKEYPRFLRGFTKYVNNETKNSDKIWLNFSDRNEN